MSVFKPEHHRLVICKRNMDREILEGHKERRNQYTVDMFSGLSWGRLGTGEYDAWSTIPPAGMMLSPVRERPRPDRPIVISCRVPAYHGVRIGRIHADTGQVLWQIYSDHSSDWIAVPVSYIEGWLHLP